MNTSFCSLDEDFFSCFSTTALPLSSSFSLLDSIIYWGTVGSGVGGRDSILAYIRGTGRLTNSSSLTSSYYSSRTSLAMWSYGKHALGFGLQSKLYATFLFLFSPFLWLLTEDYLPPLKLVCVAGLLWFDFSIGEDYVLVSSGVFCLWFASFEERECSFWLFAPMLDLAPVPAAFLEGISTTEVLLTSPLTVIFMAWRLC